MEPSQRLLSIVIIVTSIAISSTAHVVLKRGMQAKSETADGLLGTLLAVAQNPWVLTGMCLHVLALGVWLAALKRVDITFAYPFLALGYVLVALMGVLWLGESLGTTRLAGMAIIVVGIVVLSRG
ncbi:MAG: DMT family transporter [Opitutales bacterium]